MDEPASHRMSAARTLRLQKVRESSISATALLDRRLRATYALNAIGLKKSLRVKTPAQRRKQAEAEAEAAAAASVGFGVDSPMPPSKMGQAGGADGGGGAGGEAAARRFVRPGANRWKEDALFAKVDALLEGKGEMEREVWRNKVGGAREHALRRRVLRPELSQAIARLDRKQADELERRTLARVEKQVDALRARATARRDAADARGAIHADGNAQRAHTRFLTDLQKSLDVQAIEDAVLSHMLKSGDAKLIRHQAGLAKMLQGTALEKSVNPKAMFKKGLAASVGRSSLKTLASSKALVDEVKAGGGPGSPATSDGLPGSSPSKLESAKPDYVDPAKTLLRRVQERGDGAGAGGGGGGGFGSGKKKAGKGPSDDELWAQYTAAMGASGSDELPDYEAFKAACATMRRAGSAGGGPEQALSALMRDDGGFRGFWKLQQMASKRRGADGERGEGLPPLPDTPLLVKSFGSLPHRPRVVGAAASDADTATVSALLYSPPSAGEPGRSAGFANSFARRPEREAFDEVSQSDFSSVGDEPDGRAARRHAPAAADVDDDDDDHYAGAERAASPLASPVSGGSPSRGSRASAGRRSTDSAGKGARGSVSSEIMQAMQPRLERMWFELQMPMTSKLDFLQKCAARGRSRETRAPLVLASQISPMLSAISSRSLFFFRARGLLSRCDARPGTRPSATPTC